MAYRLSRGESIQQAAARIADEELGLAIDRLRAGELDPGARVHAARRAIKRVRALIRLLRAGLGACFRRDNLALRDAARRLAGPRDAVVAADVFARLVPEPTPALAAIRDRLAVTRDEVIADEAALAAAADDLTRVRAGAAGWPALARGWSVLAPGLRTSYGRGRDAMRAAYRHPSPAAFHAWRRRVKDLWYHTLLLHNVWKPVQSAWARALEDLSDILGEDHDLEVLRVALACHADLDPDARAELLARADARSGELRTAAWTLGQRLYAERPRRYVARLRRYWAAWRSDERRAPDGRRPPAEAPPRDLALPPDPGIICPGDHVSSAIPCPPGHARELTPGV